VRCGRKAASLEEINNGCPCGSKVFVFNKDSAGGDAPKSPAQAQECPAVELPLAPQARHEPAAPSTQGAGARESTGGNAREGAGAPAGAGGGGAKEGDAGSGGKAPESYFARTTFSTEDVENIKIVSEGVFCVDVNALSKNPVVLKDEDGVYYVRLPLSQNALDEEIADKAKGRENRAEAKEEDKSGK